MFGWADYLALGVVLALSAAVGFYYACTGNKQTTTNEYLTANHNMHWFPVGASLISSFISTQTLIGLPSEIYTNGAMFGLFGIPIFVGTLIGLHVFLPVFRNVGLTSVVEYVGMRFGWPLRIFCLVLNIFGMLSYMAFVIYGPALALVAATGLNLWISVAVITIVATTYTALGGLKAVLWADAVQLVIMIGGYAAVCISGIVQQDGFINVWEKNRISGRLDFLDPSKAFDIDPRARHTVFSVIITGLSTWTIMMSIAQGTVQRYLALPSKQSQYFAFGFATVGLTGFSVTGAIVGMVIYGFYFMCDPLSSGQITRKDQLYPLFVMDLYGDVPGLAGFILSAVFSASLSTLSTALSACSAIILQDIIGPIKKNMNDHQATKIAKVLNFSLGILVLGLVALAHYAKTGIMEMGLILVGVSSGPSLGIFTVGVLLPIVNQRGTLIGATLSLALFSWIAFGAFFYPPYVYKYPVTTAGCNITEVVTVSNITAVMYDPSSWNPQSNYRTGVLSLYDISYAWYGIISFGSTVLLSLLFSLLIGNKNEPLVHKDLLSPSIFQSSCILPKSWWKRVDFNVTDSKSNMNSTDGLNLQSVGETDLHRSHPI